MSVDKKSLEVSLKLAQTLAQQSKSGNVALSAIKETPAQAAAKS
jgi:hypothetical protein